MQSTHTKSDADGEMRRQARETASRAEGGSTCVTDTPRGLPQIPTAIVHSRCGFKYRANILNIVTIIFDRMLHKA